MIKEEKVLAKINNRNITHFKKLGYDVSNLCITKRAINSKKAHLIENEFRLD